MPQASARPVYNERTGAPTLVQLAAITCLTTDRDTPKDGVERDISLSWTDKRAYLSFRKSMIYSLYSY